MTDSVFVNVPPASPATCALYFGTPGTTDYTFSPTGSSFSGAVAGGVTWSDGLFHAVTLSLPSGSSGLTASVSPTDMTSAGSFTASLTGPTPTFSQDLTLEGSPDSGTADCAPATIHIVAPTSTTGTTGTHRPPWQEF